MSIGETRLENLGFSLKSFVLQFKYIYIFLLPLLLIFLKIIFKKNKNENEKADLIIILLILGTTLIFIYTQLLTRNQILIFFLIPMLAAFSHIYLINYFNKKYFIYILIITCLFSVTKYHLRFNEQKKFMDLSNVNLDLAVKGESIHPMFKGLKWITPFYPNNPNIEVKNLIEIREYITTDQKKKIIISDYQFLSAISNLKISSPNKWYDDMSVPSKKNKYFYFYKDFFVNSLKKNDIKNIYAVGTDKHLYFMDFFDDKSCIKSKAINEMFTIYDINECVL